MLDKTLYSINNTPCYPRPEKGEDMPLFNSRKEISNPSSDHVSDSLFDPRKELATTLQLGGSIRPLFGTFGNLGQGERIDPQALAMKLETLINNMPVFLVREPNAFPDAHVNINKESITLTAKLGKGKMEVVIPLENGHLATQETIKRTDQKEPILLKTVLSQPGQEADSTAKPRAFMIFAGVSLVKGDDRFGAIEYV